MRPTLLPGSIVWATGWYRRLRVGDVVIILHEGLEKVKRIERVRPGYVFVVGDNPADSTDSRQFGWLELRHVVGKMLA